MDVVTDEGENVPASQVIATGHVLEARHADGSLADHAYIVVAGDVQGTGIANIAQVTQIARALVGDILLEELPQMAADMNGNGRLDIGDLVKAAEKLTEKKTV